jgi:arylsulfatase A-like enzyme
MIGRREFLAALAAGMAGAGLSCVSSKRPGEVAARGPNVVIILADDQGYQDLGCFGSPDIKTPRIDRMAAEGMKFTDFHVAGPVCTPSRSALLTGSYPARIGLAKGVLFPKAKTGLNPQEITIAELLQGRGYATCCIGKWHLGDDPKFHPNRQGFDYFYGLPYSNDMSINPEMKLAKDVVLREGMTAARIKAEKPKNNVVPLLRQDEVIEYPADQRTLTERYTAEAIRFITANQDRPFFVYLPHSMPHVPLHVSERFAGKSRRGLYGDVIETIDWSAGQILDTLQQLGLDENTLVIYTSDNGPWLEKKENGGSALPLRDGKGTVYEGGMRVPCVMRWPGRIPAGKTCTELATAMDLLPTIAGLAGAGAPADRVIDGKNILPLMTRAGAKTPHEAFYYHNSNGELTAVRAGRWKLIMRKEPELYDLKDDVSEKHNLASANPKTVERLKGLAEKHRQDLAKNSREVGKV